MPPIELKEWVAVTKDMLLALAALATTVIAIYGARTWRRELAGKEIYVASKKLVKESHLHYRAANQTRSPIREHERKNFTEEEVKHTTSNERWRLSEAEAYKKRIDNFESAIATYQDALLEARVLIGSIVLEGFLPFGKQITEVVHRTGNYIGALQDHSRLLFPDSAEIAELQKELYPSANLDDDLTQAISNAREAGETALLEHLHRRSIYGK